MRQETDEEAAERRYGTLITHPKKPNIAVDMYGDLKIGFVEGAKWQADRSYSEEEVINAFNEGQALNVRGKLIQGKEWFEQFKKK